MKKHPYFKEYIPSLNDQELDDFIYEYRDLEYRSHQMRDSRGARIAGIALSIAWKEKNKRAKSK